MAAPDCPKCLSVSPAWIQSPSNNTDVSCPCCWGTFTLQWLVNRQASLAAVPPATVLQHSWDGFTTPAICTACLVDGWNSTAPIACPGVATNWPGSSGATNYPNCPCGMNDWVILQNNTFECHACLRQLTLAQLQFCGTTKITLGPPPPSISPMPSKFFASSGSWRTWDDDDLAVPVNKPKPVYERCTQCNRELSKVMDVYYGREPNEAKKCRPCRTNKPF